MGQFKSIVKCSQCKNQSKNLEEFWDISLAIPQTVEECHLKDCVNNYTISEILETESKCERCHRLSQFSKELVFERLPKVLMIHLKKFGNNGQKISKKVNVSQNLLIKSTNYSLKAFISHRGMNSFSGHYISYCKQSNHWYRFDDEDIRQLEDIDSSDMLSAYILFFEKR